MDCVFCDRSKFEERLCGETKDFWIIATLGQITDGGYVLLVPKRHVKCIGAIGKAQARILEKLIIKTKSVLLKEYGDSGILFEHGIVGQTIKHAHVHLIPDQCNITTRVFKDFPRNTLHFMSETAFIDLLLETYSLRQEPYLLWQDSISSNYKICWNPPAPLRYLRIVVAEAFGRPERANWRTMDPEPDKKLWSETVRRLKPYF